MEYYKQRMSVVNTVDAYLIATAMIGLCSFALRSMGHGSTFALVAGSLTAIATAMCLRWRQGHQAGFFALLTGLIFYWTLAGSFFFWPLHLLIPILGASCMVLITFGSYWLRATLALGRLGVEEWISIIALSATACIALIMWRLIGDPDFSADKAVFPSGSLLVILFGVLFFSVFNSIIEEIVWRGFILRWALQYFRAEAAIILQALSFGFAHWLGTPGGAVGTVLAFAFGLALGAVAIRSGGLAAVILIHIVADLAIGALVFS